MFFEEVRELLISLEEGLMDLERKQTDRAHLDKTFRAAHTLKGAAAMVGLGSISEFTHNIEAVLERIRSGSLPIDSDIITTLLEARDHLAAMVEAEAAKSPIPHSTELAQRLAVLLRGPAQGRRRRKARQPAPRLCVRIRTAVCAGTRPGRPVVSNTISSAPRWAVGLIPASRSQSGRHFPGAAGRKPTAKKSEPKATQDAGSRGTRMLPSRSRHAASPRRWAAPSVPAPTAPSDRSASRDR